MDEKKKNEILAFFWFLIAALVLLSLLTYTPDDVALETSVPNSPALNFVGPAGAYTAWFLTLLFGKTAYFLTPLFLFWALAKWAGKKGQKVWIKIFSSAVFIASACALFSLMGSFDGVARFQRGGLLGFFASIFLANIFGHASVFVCLSLFLLSILLATELLILQMVVGLAHKIQAVWRQSRDQSVGSADPKPVVVAKTAAELTSKFNEFKARVAEKVTPKGAIGKAGQAVTKDANGASQTEDSVKPRIKLATDKFAAPSNQNGKKPFALFSKPADVRLAKDKSGSSKEDPLEQVPVQEGEYKLPSTDLLEQSLPADPGKVKEDLETSSKILEETLRDFGIDAKVVEVEGGPTIVRYELQPAAGVKVQKITALENDIALAMRATSVRILAPIPGKARVGIEVPNRVASTVSLREVILSPEFDNEHSKIAMAIGKDTAGDPVVCNLADMPHILIAGATNTGKSVCINSIISSILFRATPEEVKLLIIDPKMVELHFYNDLPHLICPVVTDKQKVPGALLWLVGEMERRYKSLSRVGAKNILSFNEKVDKKQINAQTLRQNDADPNDDQPLIVKRMPYIVVVIDELADLMIAQAQEIEGTITRLAQLARAVGIHMILATQRPSVDVITGVIKANFPARIAFQVASKVDSRTILDENGADKLLGRGDFLLMDPRKSKLIRGQGSWVQDAEIERITNFIKNQRKPVYSDKILQETDHKHFMAEFKKDEMYEAAKKVIIESGQASVSMVQRRLGLGYTRAARLIDMMEEEGIVGPYRGAKPREILVGRPSEQQVQTEEDKQ